MKAEVLHLLPIQPEKSGFRSWKHLHWLLLQHLHQQLLQHLHQHQLCHAWLWNGNQKLFIARQIKAFQFIVLHHRVEALRPNGCVLQLENTFWHISISIKVLLNLQRLEDRVLLQGALQITTFHGTLVYTDLWHLGEKPPSPPTYIPAVCTCQRVQFSLKNIYWFVEILFLHLPRMTQSLQLRQRPNRVLVMQVWVEMICYWTWRNVEQPIVWTSPKVVIVQQ